MKTLLIWTLLSIGLVAVGQASQAATVGYWRFEPGAFLSDTSGGNHTLRVVSNAWGVSSTVSPLQVRLPTRGDGSAFPKTIPSTKMGNIGAAQGSGDRGKFAQSYFYVPAQESFKFTRGFTIEALISQGAPTGVAKTIASQGGGLENGGWFFGLNGANQLIFQFARKAGPWAEVALSQSLLPEDGVKFVAGHDFYVATVFQCEPSVSYEVTFYVQDLTDGSPLRVIRKTGRSVVVGFYDTRFGLTLGGSALGDWGGLIDEVRLSDGVLAAEELLISVRR